jgi:chemotaxis methyl-accepting protein methylase
MDDDHFRILLEYLNYSWSGYRKVRKGVKKRIQRHMQQLNCRSVTDYLKILDHGPDRRHECELLMSVSISRFFRDRRLWELLENNWLPGLVTGHSKLFKVWSAGCACGEEVYSFKIIWDRLGKRLWQLPVLDLLATDRHPDYLERARSGLYNRSSLKEVTPDWLELYFDSRRGQRQFVIKKDLERGIRWQIHHLSADPPGRDFNIICLRNNILTYCRQKAQKRALTGILDSLAPGGILIIGCHEKLPIEISFLKPMAELSYVFKKC